MDSRRRKEDLPHRDERVRSFINLLGILCHLHVESIVMFSIADPKFLVMRTLEFTSFWVRNLICTCGCVLHLFFCGLNDGISQCSTGLL